MAKNEKGGKSCRGQWLFIRDDGRKVYSDVGEVLRGSYANV